MGARGRIWVLFLNMNTQVSSQIAKVSENVLEFCGVGI